MAGFWFFPPLCNATSAVSAAQKKGKRPFNNLPATTNVYLEAFPYTVSSGKIIVRAV